MADSAPLTGRQHEVLRFIRAYRRERGIAPTLEEVARHLRVHRVTVFGHVRELIRKGYVSKSRERISRSLQLLPSPSTALAYPLLGRIRAGAPLEAFEVPETFDFSALFPADRDIYVLRVHGDSMVDDGIHDGDFVLVERRSDARDGETVVAAIDGQEVTLKRLYREGSRFRLEPANPRLAPIFADRIELRGVVVGLVRKT
jgi:repressor LexA